LRSSGLGGDSGDGGDFADGGQSGHGGDSPPDGVPGYFRLGLLGSSGSRARGAVVTHSEALRLPGRYSRIAAQMPLNVRKSLQNSDPWFLLSFNAATWQLSFTASFIRHLNRNYLADS
jgi:hypothetical protein